MLNPTTRTEARRIIQKIREQTLDLNEGNEGAAAPNGHPGLLTIAYITEEECLALGRSLSQDIPEFLFATRRAHSDHHVSGQAFGYFVHCQ